MDTPSPPPPPLPWVVRSSYHVITSSVVEPLCSVVFDVGRARRRSAANNTLQGTISLSPHPPPPRPLSTSGLPLPPSAAPGHVVLAEGPPVQLEDLEDCDKCVFGAVAALAGSLALGTLGIYRLR